MIYQVINIQSVKISDLKLRSDLCDYSDAYIIIKGVITLDGTANANKRNKKLTFKNNSPVRSCISKINNTLIDNVEDLGIVMLCINCYSTVKIIL